MSEDTRNVIDEFKGLDMGSITSALDARGSGVEIAVENTLRDYNMGTIVRTANAFGIRTVHVIGRRQWNKRGAMMTDKYLRVVYHERVANLRAIANDAGKRIIAVDNVAGAKQLQTIEKRSSDILLFGQEGPGISEHALAVCDDIVEIEQRGSTRSINVGVAAGIIIYQWTR